MSIKHVFMSLLHLKYDVANSRSPVCCHSRRLCVKVHRFKVPFCFLSVNGTDDKQEDSRFLLNFYLTSKF